MPLRFIILFLLPFLLLSYASSQPSSVYSDLFSDYKRGLELFRNRKYGPAQKSFEKAMEKIGNSSSQTSIDAQYHAALCALELFNKDAEPLLMQFIEQHPESPFVYSVYFQLGKYYFRKKEWPQVIDWFNKVDIYDLTNEELAEYYFKLGYSYFMSNEFDKAQTVFFEIKEINSKFATPALYFYSHIQYLNKNYETALDGFLRIADSTAFTPVAPYYITQIYYLQEKYDKVIEYAPPLLDSASVKRAPEIARLIGEAYYHKENYDAAVPFLERYQREAGRITREDLYELGYAYYKSGNFNSAIETFKQVTKENDVFAQLSFYHMASCYMEKNQKDFARHAFRAASMTDFDKNIREDAMYNFAKLSYELDINSISALDKYINAYPATPRADEANSMLADVYLRTKNYKNALLSLEKISNPDQRLRTAYQKIAYSRGVELFNDRKYDEALLHFDKSLGKPQDKTIELLCHYWKGEAYYRMGQISNAIVSYQKFIFQPGAFNLEVFNLSYYNLGYCYFDLKDYVNAMTWFRKFARNAPPSDAARKGDAWLRSGDCSFALKDFGNAIDFYDSAIVFKALDTDYALFQKSIALGVTGHKNEKIQTLLSLLSGYKQSPYTDDAKYELGFAYMETGEPMKGLPYFQNIIQYHSASSYVKKAMLKSGVIYYNAGQNDTALGIFKKVIASYPATPEAMEALASCKNIYVQSGKVDEYAALVQGLSFANITRAELDTATYEAAELFYQKGNCAQAIRNFENYLMKFPDGIFRLHANFYKSECYYKSGNADSSLQGYMYAAEQAKNLFTEKSLLQLSSIFFSKKDYNKGLLYFGKLEETAELRQNVLFSYCGLMRCHSALNNHELVIKYADKVIAFEKAGADLVAEAHLLKGKASLALDDYNTAFSEVQQTAKMNSEMGAEAKYISAYIQYMRGNYKQSEEMVFHLSKQVPSYDYWVAKGFILLADNYVMMNNVFQAKATLQSIIDNYDGQELIDIAKSKLNKIVETEKPGAQNIQPAPQIEIGFDQQDIDYDKLFEEEKIEE